MNFRLLLSGLVALALALGTTAVAADRGVGVDKGVLEVSTKLQPGKGYTLPVIGVLNTGDEPTDYSMSVGYLEEQQQQRPGESWFSFDPPEFSLSPGESRGVHVGLDVPPGADPGDYFVLVRAQTVTGRDAAANVGVAAATKVTFSIQPSSWLEAQRNRLSRWLDDAAPWTYLVPAALLLTFLATKAHKLPFRVRVERKQ